MNEYKAKRERSRVRSATYSMRHRLYGEHVPATDLDFVEYDRAKTVALTEAKMEGQTLASESAATTKVKQEIADALDVPFIPFSHNENLTRITLLPTKAGMATQAMSELDWVKHLYSLRNRIIPGAIADLLVRTPVIQYRWKRQRRLLGGDWEDDVA